MTVSLIGGTPGGTAAVVGPAPIAPVVSASTPIASVTQSSPDSRDLERLLPSPVWVVENRDELGIDESVLMPLRSDLKQTRRQLSDQRARLRKLRSALRQELVQEPLDRLRIEQLFEETLALENDMKRTQLGARLDVMNQISATQRERVRSLSERAPQQRRKIRRHIEDIRSLSRGLRDRGGDAEKFRERLQRIEQLIRSGRLGDALQGSNALRDDLSQALRSQPALIKPAKPVKPVGDESR